MVSTIIRLDALATQTPLLYIQASDERFLYTIMMFVILQSADWNTCAPAQKNSKGGNEWDRARHSFYCWQLH